MKINKDDMKKYMVLVAAMMIAGMVSAQEVEGFESAEIADTLIANVDTVELDPDPEWYVAPLVPEALRAPQHAPRKSKAATSCVVDSILRFNSDSVLIEVSMYEYDQAGRTIREMIWNVNEDGSRYGSSRVEYAFNSAGTQTMTASYDWDNETNNWKGTQKTEFVYNAFGKMDSQTTFDWTNGDWLPKTRITYLYDASNRVSESYNYARDLNLQLVLTKGLIQTWYDNSNKTLLIDYTAYDGENPSAGTKKEWTYDTNGNKQSYTSYAYSDGSWVNSTNEVWNYDDLNRKTYYKKESWTSDAWKTSNEEFTEYDGYGNISSLEKYTLKNGALAGSFKEEYVYNGDGEQTSILRYKWTNGAWVYNVWNVSNYDEDGNSIEECTYSWKNGAWVGNGTRTLTTYNPAGDIMEEITQKWPTNATDWVNYTRVEYKYLGSKKIHEASYVWQTDYWKGDTRADYHYISNNVDTIWRYTFDSNWEYSERVVYTYTGSTIIMTHNASWNGSGWVMTSMSRTDIVTENNKTVLKTTWTCSADSIWVGGTKDTTAYSAAGKQIFTARYTYNNGEWKPSTKTETDYDSSNRQIDNRKYSWNTTTNDWKGTSRTEKKYDVKGNEILNATYNGWIAATNSWKGNKKTEKSYGANNLLDTMITSSWSTTISDWLPSIRYSYGYDASKREIKQVVENYSTSTWINSTKYEKEYKGSQKIKDNTYDWLNNQWVFKSRNETYYDAEDNKLRRQITGTWSNGVVLSFSDKLYFYDLDFPLHTIRFVNHDGTLLESKDLRETKTPAYTGKTPTKPATAQYTYLFKGWSPNITKVTGDATYTADYDSIVNRYRITWLNVDDTEIAADSLDYGATPSHEDLAKTNTAEWTYSFAGWTPAITTVVGEATYKAQFDSIRNAYLVTFKNGEDTLQSALVAYGSMPVYGGETPTKQADVQYSYTFNGWDAELVSVTGEATYNATFNSNVNNYLVTFKNGADTLQSTMLAYGAMPEYNGDEPTKQGDAQYSYTFNGWDAELVSVTGEATYNATFNSNVNNYLVTFKNGADTLQSTMLAYGAMPEYTGNEPTKQADAQYTYSFNGWDAELVSVIGEATYNATFSSTINNYRITFKNDGDTLQSTLVAYGTMPVYGGETPTKQADVQYSYTFNGWDAELVSVTGEATYNATFNSNVNNYLVTFKNGADTLQSTMLAYGAMPEYNGDEPTKQGDAQYTYSFNGWDAELVEVTGETTYNATFSSTINNYTITWLLDDGTKIDEESVAYGTTPSHTDAHKDNTAQYTITFVGWDKEFEAVTGDETYTAVFDSVVNSYTVIFYFEDGVTVLDSLEVEYGQTPITSLIPSLPATPKYTYTFAGWSPELQPVTGNAGYTAVFDSIVNTYTVTFVNYDNTELQSTMVPYDSVPEYTGETPFKPSNAMYHYVFTGWTPELVAVTGDARYKAVYDQVLNRYTIIFYDEDGITVLDSVEVDYGEMPETSVIPTKADDEEYTYTFAGWSPKIVTATKNTSYTATYTATRKTEGLWDVEAAEKVQKVMIDGVIYIRRGGKIYTLDGTEVE